MWDRQFRLANRTLGYGGVAGRPRWYASCMSPADVEARHELLELHKSFKRWRVGATAAFVLLFASSWFAVQQATSLNAESRDAIVQSGTVVAVEGCNRDYITIKAEIANIESRRTNLKILTDEPKKKLPAYQEALANLDKNQGALEVALPDCRRSARLITDSESALSYNVPTPLHD